MPSHGDGMDGRSVGPTGWSWSLGPGGSLGTAAQHPVERSETGKATRQGNREACRPRNGSCSTYMAIGVALHDSVVYEAIGAWWIGHGICIARCQRRSLIYTYIHLRCSSDPITHSCPAYACEASSPPPPLLSLTPILGTRQARLSFIFSELRVHEICFRSVFLVPQSTAVSPARLSNRNTAMRA